MEITTEKGADEDWKQILDTDSSVSAKAKVTDHVYFDIEEVRLGLLLHIYLLHDTGSMIVLTQVTQRCAAGWQIDRLSDIWPVWGCGAADSRELQGACDWPGGELCSCTVLRWGAVNVVLGWELTAYAAGSRCCRVCRPIALLLLQGETADGVVLHYTVSSFHQIIPSAGYNASDITVQVSLDIAPETA